MALRKGSRVEVSSDEDGFKGAWFTATVTKMVGKTRIMVEYDNLVSDDENGPLVETLEIVNVRPLPPVPDTPHAFSLYEEVDAFYNDGWWVGVISKVVAEDGSKYAVYFRNTREEMIFEFNQMRVHQDFIDGHWVMASQKLLAEEQPIKNEDCIPHGNCSTTIENCDGVPSTEPKMDPVVETSPLQVPELKKCGSKKGRGKKHSLSPSSSLPPKGPEEPEEENDDCIIMEAIHAPEKTSRKRGRGTQLDKPVKTPTIRRAKMKAEDDGRMGVVAPSPGVNPSQNNKKSKTKTKDLVKKTKKGEDNGSTCMAALSSMVNLSQNSNKAKDFGEGETDGVKFDRVIVSIPQMGVSEKSRADNLTMLTGTCKDLSLAAYYLVLQALYLQGDPKWGHEVLLAELRTALAISNDEHVEELKRVTSNKFIATSFLKR